MAISADGGRVVLAPSDVAPSYSINHGSSWNSLSAYLPTGVTVISDGANANLFYAYVPSTGVLYCNRKVWRSAF